MEGWLTAVILPGTMVRVVLVGKKNLILFFVRTNKAP